MKNPDLPVKFHLTHRRTKMRMGCTGRIQLILEKNVLGKLCLASVLRAGFTTWTATKENLLQSTFLKDF